MTGLHFSASLNSGMAISLVSVDEMCAIHVTVGSFKPKCNLPHTLCLTIVDSNILDGTFSVPLVPGVS